MCLGCSKSDDIASPEETTQLNLSGGPARLSDDRGSRDGNETRLEPSAMIGPDVAVVAVRRDEYPGVVDGAQADRFRDAASSWATR